MPEDFDASFYDQRLKGTNQVLMLKLLVCHELKKYLPGTKFHMVETN